MMNNEWRESGSREIELSRNEKYIENSSTAEVEHEASLEVNIERASLSPSATSHSPGGNK